MIAIAAVRFAVTRDKLKRHPAEHVVDDRRRVADFRILRKTRRLEPLVGKFFHQRLQGHTVLQRHARERADTVHQAADGGAFLGHSDKQFARPAIFEQAHRQVTFMTGNVEFMGDRGAGFR